MRLRVGARTDTGRVRELNEDVYVARAEQGLFLVCDGMGGCPAGEVASQMAATVILDHVSAKSSTVRSGPAGSEGLLPRTCLLAEAVRRSNRFIYGQAKADPNQAEMGTTVVTVWLAEHIASVAHVGDSRAYLWHRGGLEPLTRDHSLVEAVKARVVDRTLRVHAQPQNVLLRVVGREPQVEVELNEVAVQPGDYLVLCSDGLTSMVPERTLARAIGELRDPQRICDHLVDVANRNGGSDNITIVAVEVKRGWWRRLSNGWRRQAGGGHDAEARPAV